MWGYSPLSPYAVESAFGTSDELAELIDACHARGLRVMQDAVYNHLHENAPLNRIDPSYWFYMQNPDDPDLHFGPKLNYEMHDEALGLFPAREYVLGALERWVSHFHVDGIRFDCTRAIRMHEVLHWFGDETHNRAGMKPFFTVADGGSGVGAGAPRRAMVAERDSGRWAIAGRYRRGAGMIARYGEPPVIDFDQPAGTVHRNTEKDLIILTQSGNSTTLTIPELARLQGFPDDWIWTGTKTAQARQVGNAVPPIMAQLLAFGNQPDATGVASRLPLQPEET